MLVGYRLVLVVEVCGRDYAGAHWKDGFGQRRKMLFDGSVVTGEKWSGDICGEGSSWRGPSGLI